VHSAVGQYSQLLKMRKMEMQSGGGGDGGVEEGPAAALSLLLVASKRRAHKGTNVYNGSIYLCVYVRCLY
jgi:hypothetical protein